MPLLSRFVSIPAVLVGTFLGMSGNPASAQTTVPAVNATQPITFSLEENCFFVGEPILLRYSITNKMQDHFMGIASGHQNLSWLNIQIEAENGKALTPLSNTSAVHPTAYVDGVPLYPGSDRYEATKFRHFIMPHETSDGYIRVSEKFPVLRPGRYRISIHAALVTSASPVSPKMPGLPPANPPVKLAPPHSAGTIKHSMVIGFTILPVDKATLDTRGAQLRETVMTGSPSEVSQATHYLMAWPREFAPSLWGSVLQDPRLVPSQRQNVINTARREANKGNPAAINLLAYLTWETKQSDERGSLVAIRRYGDALVKRQIEGIFTLNKELIPDKPPILHD